MQNSETKSLSDADLQAYKEWLMSHLKAGKVTVVFTKRDGSERTMKCTTDPTYILFKDPKFIESNSLNVSANNGVLPVYDVEANGWRSFRWDSILRVELTESQSNVTDNQTQ